MPPHRTVRPTLSLVGGVATQEYQAHSDWIDMQAQQPSGPRVFTFFLYLRLTMHSTALHIPVLPPQHTQAGRTYPAPMGTPCLHVISAPACL